MKKLHVLLFSPISSTMNRYIPNSIHIDAYGAQGATSEGGEGGYPFGKMAVTQGQQIYIYSVVLGVLII